MQYHQSNNFNNGNIDQIQSQQKRMRTGSISGRLRTASDLEDSGVIDKYQKGIIKDLIISGDIALQQSLDKCEKGDTSSLTDLIKRGCLARRQSIDLLDGLDFEFLNGIKTEDDDLGCVFDDDLMFDFVNDQLSGGVVNTSGTFNGDMGTRRVGSIDVHDDKHQRGHNARTSSMDSNFSGNFRMFDNMTMFRGHSFGDEANLLMSGTDVDNLYYEDERYEEGGAGGDDGGNLYSIGHHHSAFTDHADSVGAPPTKRQSKKQNDGILTDITQLNGNIDMSAYENHAASLRNNMREAESGGLKASLKGRQNRGVPKNTMGSDSTPEQLANNNQFRQFTENGSFASGSSKPSGLKNSEASFGGASTIGRKSKGIPTFNQFSNAAHSATNFGAAASGYIDDEKGIRGGGVGGSGLMAYKLSANLAGPTGGVGFIGAYSPEQRRLRIEKFFEKRNRRVWTKKVKYDVRKNFADSRLRIKGRFVKKEDEDIMRELLDI